MAGRLLALVGGYLRAWDVDSFAWAVARCAWAVGSSLQADGLRFLKSAPGPLTAAHALLETACGRKLCLGLGC